MKSKENIIEIFNDITNNKYKIYYKSFNSDGSNYFFLVKDLIKKYLIIIGDLSLIEKFEGDFICSKIIDQKRVNFKKSHINYKNLQTMQKYLPYLNPILCKSKKSFGTGDRIGMVTASHISAFKGRDIFPILAQQSPRELNKTGRSWKDVVSDAVWGYFEAGYKIPFGTDADHVKETSDLKSAVDFGFTMFTVDPSDHIRNISDHSNAEVTKIYNSLRTKEVLEKKYIGKKIVIAENDYYFDSSNLVLIASKYVEAINHVINLYNYLKSYKKDDFDFEVSMDEIEIPVSPQEHYFIANELTEAGVNFQNLALRFVGKWEKAVDYVGDIKLFEEDLKKHVEISKKSGEYKLSLHSGSEKFSIYKAFSELTEGNFHIKTAGTSWLEALRVIAIKKPSLFRDIYSFSLKSFEKDKASYHLSTNITDLSDNKDSPDEDLANFLDISSSRQILHVTFGSILTLKDKGGNYIFRDKIYSILNGSEDIHYGLVRSNIDKHLNLLAD
jgi:hypothetical protein